ncbi:hypothetical protein [Nocardioides jiangxiensis]|uniref:Lipoprotein LprG n=1 Tax=Nocardioides jiangxiensis TaxID=3064524 RepID=A0ABT9AWY7_9ACTN|nr:hypothetical protein [Nocardioides sp. WY-20]MDO7867019.1 hypothetical protein [Nocardioides sp. WY-20]
MTTPARRRLAAAGLAGVALLGSLSLAACGDDEPAAKAPCGLKDTRKGHLTAKNAAAALAKAAEGRKTLTFRQEMTINGKTAAIEGSVDASPDKIYGLSQTMPGDDGTVKLILKDDRVYVSAEGEQDGKFYVVDPDQKGDPLAAPLKAWFDQSGAAATANAWTVGLLAVNYVKTETLDDGTRAELYEFQIDPRIVARASGITPPPGLEQSSTSYVWVDRYDLIRKVETTGKDERTVETFTDYCEPVDIKAPDASDLIQR